MIEAKTDAYVLSLSPGSSSYKLTWLKTLWAGARGGKRIIHSKNNKLNVNFSNQEDGGMKELNTYDLAYIS